MLANFVKTSPIHLFRYVYSIITIKLSYDGTEMSEMDG